MKLNSKKVNDLLTDEIFAEQIRIVEYIIAEFFRCVNMDAQLLYVKRILGNVTALNILFHSRCLLNLF